MGGMILKPVTTEKAVKMIDTENTLTFETGRRERKNEIKSEIEKIYGVKVVRMGTLIRKNKKIVYARLGAKNPAIDVVTKLGMI